MRGRSLPVGLSDRNVSTSDANGGEGDRTPDLVNAIHALSQLSYAPIILARPRTDAVGAQHGKLVLAPWSVKQLNEEEETGYPFP